jgi:hypothetical protein
VQAKVGQRFKQPVMRSGDDSSEARGGAHAHDRSHLHPWCIPELVTYPIWCEWSGLAIDLFSTQG